MVSDREGSPVVFVADRSSWGRGAHRSCRFGPSPTSSPGPVPLGRTSWSPRPRRRGAVPDPRIRQFLFHRSGRRDLRRARSAWSASATTRSSPTTRTTSSAGLCRRPYGLSELLRPHGSPEPGPARRGSICPCRRATDPEELARRISAGEWVVDLRSQTAYAAEHLAGTIGISLAQHFSLYLGWLLPWGTPLTLLGEDPKQISAARRQLVVSASTTWPERRSDAECRRAEHRAANVSGDRLCGPRSPSEAVVLDVRRDDERVESHIAGSVHVPLHLLLERIDTLPCDTLWVPLRQRLSGQHRGQSPRSRRTKCSAHR